MLGILGCVEVVCKEDPEGGGGGGGHCSTPFDNPNPPNTGTTGALDLAAGCNPDTPIEIDPDPLGPLLDICAGSSGKGAGIIDVLINDGGR